LGGVRGGNNQAGEKKWRNSRDPNFYESIVTEKKKANEKTPLLRRKKGMEFVPLRKDLRVMKNAGHRQTCKRKIRGVSAQ